VAQVTESLLSECKAPRTTKQNKTKQKKTFGLGAQNGKTHKPRDSTERVFPATFNHLQGWAMAEASYTSSPRNKHPLDCHHPRRDRASLVSHYPNLEAAGSRTD
jgi:hypothetical protein